MHDLLARAGLPAAAPADRLVLDLGIDLEPDKDRAGAPEDRRQFAREIADLLEGMGAGIAGGERELVIGDVLRVRHGLAAGRRVALVVEQEMIEIGGRLLGDRREHAEAHQDVALGIEQHELALGPREREAEPEPGMAAHRRVAERRVELRVGGLLDPIAAAAARHDDRVAAIRAEGFERFGNAHHFGCPPLSG